MHNNLKPGASLAAGAGGGGGAAGSSTGALRTTYCPPAFNSLLAGTSPLLAAGAGPGPGPPGPWAPGTTSGGAVVRAVRCLPREVPNLAGRRQVQVGMDTNKRLRGYRL
jgi:hypothetical protein